MLMPDYTLSSIFVCANVCIRVHLCHIVSQYVYVSKQSYLLLDIIFLLFFIELWDFCPLLLFILSTLCSPIQYLI